MSLYVNVAISVPVHEIFTYQAPADSGIRKGCRVEVLFRGRKLVGCVVEILPSEPDVNFIIKPVNKVLDTDPLLNEYQLELAAWISRRFFCTWGEAVNMMLPGGRKEIAAEGVFPESALSDIKKIRLSDEQSRAIEGIMDGSSRQYYVQGITGSGKTEVFLQCAKRVLDAGKSVIYLVPEIALTHQLVEDIVKRFGNIVGVLHSRLTSSAKLDQWKRILKGECRFVIGARSAVFAPVQSPGLIIVDEEHENSYKSGSSPRYHARQIAMKICADFDALLIMGSATPSLEAYHLIKEGSIKAFQLTQRLAGGTLPDVRIIDLRKSGSSLSPELISLLHRTREEGHQSILFLNRRGFSYFYHCKSCGYELCCKSCSVPLTFHKNRNKMICHYCGYTVDPHYACPDCGSLDTGYSGFGTQKIEEDLRSTFPGYTIERLDTDAVKKRGALEYIIGQFEKGRIDILLGTQMVAKGLNFPNVKLVGIVQADTSLKLPDFRAAERTFSLVTQVAGRAGRFLPDGIVLVQTFLPDAPAINMAAGYRLEEFYDLELNVRQSLGFPPFARIVRIVFRGKNNDAVERRSTELASAMRASCPPEIEILGPSECPLAIISGNHRQHVIIRTTNYGLLHHFCYHFYRQTSNLKDVYLEFDPDPLSLL